MRGAAGRAGQVVDEADDGDETEDDGDDDANGRLERRRRRRVVVVVVDVGRPRRRDVHVNHSAHLHTTPTACQ